jgi:hypothetical protein
MSEKSIYHYQRQDNENALGDTHRFIGPNINRFGSSIQIFQPFNEWAKEHWTKEYSDNEAQKIVYLLNAAYEAGRVSMQQDIKHILGIRGP